MKFKQALLILVAGSITAVPALAGEAERGKYGGGSPMMHERMEDPERRVDRMSRWLELDENQRQEVSNIMMAASPRLKSLREREMANHEKIANLSADDPDYSVRIQDIAAENGQIATEKTLVMAEMRTNIHAVLTPEQQQKMADGADHMRERAGAHRRSREEGHHDSEHQQEF